MPWPVETDSEEWKCLLPQLVCDASALTNVGFRAGSSQLLAPWGSSPPDLSLQGQEWPGIPGGWGTEAFFLILPTQPRALGFVTRSIVAQMSDLFSVFILTNTNQACFSSISSCWLWQPFSKLLVSLTQSQSFSQCFKTYSEGKLLPRAGRKVLEGKNDTGFPDPWILPPNCKKVQWVC